MSGCDAGGSCGDKSTQQLLGLYGEAGRDREYARGEEGLKEGVLYIEGMENENYIQKRD